MLRRLRSFAVAMFLVAIALPVSPAHAAVALARSIAWDKYGFIVRYPDGWTATRQSNVLLLANTASVKARGAALDQLARIYITVEERRSHEEALQRLHEASTEYDRKAEYLTVSGWPAEQKVRVIEVPPIEAEDAGPNKQELRITTAIAAGNLLIREDAFMPPSTDASIQEQVRAIETGLAIRRQASNAVQREMERLPSMPDNFYVGPPVPSLHIPIKGLSGGAASPSAPQQVLSLSEPGIAVSTNGKTVFISAGSGNAATYMISIDGGQHFGAARNIPGPTDGDASAGYGQSGNIYDLSLNLVSGTIPLYVVTPASLTGATPLKFLTSAFLCPPATLPNGTPNPNPLACIYKFGKKPGVPIPDQEQIAVDRWNKGSGGGDQIYVVWRNGGVNWDIACSNNGGSNFSNPQQYPGDHARVTVARDGSVYVVYGAPSGANTEIERFNSCNGGLTVKLAATTVTSAASVQCPVPGLDRCQYLQSPIAAADDTDTTGNHVYIAYAQNTSFNASTGAGNENIVVQDSTTGGSTWSSPPTTISSSASARRFLPWVCTANGTAWVAWFDRGAATAAANDLTSYLLESVSKQGNNLVPGSIINLSGNTDRQCGARWPSGESTASCPAGTPGCYATTCAQQPENAGQCQLACANTQAGCPGGNNGSGTTCDFANPVCKIPGESCQAWGGGAPKYGDYNVNACSAAAAGRIYTAWMSATPPKNATAVSGGSPPKNSLQLYFDYTDAQSCGGGGQACCVSPQCHSGFVCASNFCSCGGPGQPCCSGSQCGGELQCSAGKCTACGQTGEACCSGNTCLGKGVCSGGKCSTCGQAGGACCAGNVCEAGGTCVQGRCACGGLGQPCCHPSGTCTNGLSCVGGGCEKPNQRCVDCVQTLKQCQTACRGDAKCSCACSVDMVSCLKANNCPPAGSAPDCNPKPPQNGQPPAPGGTFGRADIRHAAASIFEAAYKALGAQDGMTKDQADEMLDELRHIRKLLEQQPAPPAGQPAPNTPVHLDLPKGVNALGNPQAKVAMVEFTDYQCPYCAAFHAETFPKLKAAYIDTGKIWFVSRDLPLSMHENASKAAEAAHCAGDQGKFWEMRNTLISNNTDLGTAAMLRYAHALSLNERTFKTCLDSGAHAQDVRKDAAAAGALQIDGTPTFLIGTMLNGRFTGKVVSGAQPYTVFENLIRDAAQTRVVH